MKTVAEFKAELIAALNALTVKNEVTGHRPLTKQSAAYQMVKGVIEKGGGTIRPNYYQGSGRYTSVAEHAGAVLVILRELGITHEYGNDAPRGGKTGAYIKVTL